MRRAFAEKIVGLKNHVMSCQESPIEYRNSMASPPPVYRMDWAAEEINMFAPAIIANIANMM